MMPVTGCSSSAGDVQRRGLRLLAVGERDPRLDVGDVAGALGAPARRDARCRRAIASALPQSTTCSSAVSAPSGRISANANGFVSGCLPARGSATHVNDCTRAGGPDLDPVVAVGRDRLARRRVVLGRRHEHAAVGEAHAFDAAVAQPGEEAPDHGPDRARVAARVLEHVVGGQRFSHEPSSLTVSCRFRSRGRGLPSTGRGACASTACRWARAAARRRSRCVRGHLYLPSLPLDVLDDRRAQRVVGGDARQRLDDRLDLLAHVVVGDAEHRDVGDLRVLVDHALDLGRDRCSRRRR